MRKESVAVAQIHFIDRRNNAAMKDGVDVKYVWLILKADLMSLFSKGSDGFKSKLRLIFGLLLYAGLGIGIYYGAYKLFDYLNAVLVQAPGLSDAVALNIFNGLAVYVIVLVFLSGLQITFRTLYESDDIEFLLSQPVPTKWVFASKLITSYITLAPMTIVFGLPVWFAWGYVNRVGFTFYLTTFLSFMLLLVTIHALLTFILLLAMRYLPGAGLKRLFVAVGAVLGLVIVFASQVLSSKFSQVTDPMEMMTQIGNANFSRTWYLPTTWAVNWILGTVERFNMNPIYYAVPLVSLSVALAWLAVEMSHRWYFVGWSGLSENSSLTLKDAAKNVKKFWLKFKKKDCTATIISETSVNVPKSKDDGQLWAKSTYNMQGTFWTVLRKDIKLLFRDPVLWYTFATSSIALGFFIYNTTREGNMQVQGSFGTGQTVFASTLIMMVCLMGSVVGAQTGGVSLSREGLGFWILQANPTSSADLFKAKLTYAILPSILLMIPFFIIFEFTPLPHYPLWYELLLGLSITSIVASLQILLDVYFPNFNLRVEIGSSKKGGGKGKLILTMFAGMGLTMVLGFLLMFPAIRQNDTNLETIVHGTLVGIALLTLYFGTKLGSRQVRKLLKSD